MKQTILKLRIEKKKIKKEFQIKFNEGLLSFICQFNDSGAIHVYLLKTMKIKKNTYEKKAYCSPAFVLSKLNHHHEKKYQVPSTRLHSPQNSTLFAKILDSLSELTINSY